MKEYNKIVELIKCRLNHYKSVSVDNHGFSIVEYTYINGIRHSIWIYSECICGVYSISTPNNQKYECWSCKENLYHSNFIQIIIKEDMK